MQSGNKCEDNDNNEDSDVWISEDEDNISNRDDNTPSIDRNEEKDNLSIQSLKRKHEKQGYLDGITKARELSLQQGFDEGYPIGSQIGEIVGQLIAKTCARFEAKKITQEDRKRCLKELQIENVLQSKYFDDSLSIGDPRNHKVLEYWIHKLSEK